MTNITISEGESVSFTIGANSKGKKIELSDPQFQQQDDPEINLDDVSLLQVITDEVNGKYREVVGGFKCEKLDNKFIVRFKLAGEYLIKLQNHPRNPPPIRINVITEQPLSLLITDDGFLPKIIRIDEGTTVKWTWTKLAFPHSIYEAEYCDSHCGLFRTSKELVIPTLTNSYKRTFDEPGVFYFQTECKNSDQKHVCIVEVQQSYREHGIEIFDNKFSPTRTTIEEGDKVWFYWNKEKCQKKHCVYQILPPSPDHPSDKAYIHVKNGFRWSTPSRSGMMCHVFDKCGIYYFSDISGDECSSYIGIIVVKQKPEHHIINFDENSKRFENDILTVETGDLIWWKWNKHVNISMCLTEASLLFDNQINFELCEKTGGCDQLDANGLARSGIYSYKIYKSGCYYFRVVNEKDAYIITVIATASQKDHKIVVSDIEAKPNILNIYPEDRVWFVWDDTKRAHNIRQVNHSNQLVMNGFLSGSLMDSPGAFVQTFDQLGIYYYRSDNTKSVLGAVVVLPEPTIQVVHVNEKGLEPDPIIIRANDVVIWEFPTYQHNDLVLVKSESDFVKYIEMAEPIDPRRFLSRAFKDPGLYHFITPSFDTTIDQKYLENAKGLDKTIISTVIVDKIEEYSTVLVDADGFHPDLINVQLGSSILFDWRETNETHNIIHVTLPSDRMSLKIIDGALAFNSGKPVLNNSFLHTFEDEGTFCVVSEGAKNTFCLINVLKSAHKTATPKLVNQDQCVLYKYHKIFLDCETPDSTIHYTTDGSTPSKLTPCYVNENGIIMNEEGIVVIRAIAFSEKYLTSEIFTSNRFYVIADPDSVSNKYSSTEPIETSSEVNQEWWHCIPKIMFNSLGVGCIEILWERPTRKSLEMISHYQIYLNKVSYRQGIIPEANRVLIKGLAGSRSYEATVMVYPKSSTLLPQQSNVVTIKCNKTTNLGGPIISLKANPKKDQITVCWHSIDTAMKPVVDHYEMLINGEKRETIKPAFGKMKLTIEGCEPGVDYSLLLIAIPIDGTMPLISNELEVRLPLDLEEIRLPDPSLRNLDADYYDEYIEITDDENARDRWIQKRDLISSNHRAIGYRAIARPTLRTPAPPPISKSKRDYKQLNDFWPKSANNLYRFSKNLLTDDKYHINYFGYIPINKNGNDNDVFVTSESQPVINDLSTRRKSANYRVIRNELDNSQTYLAPNFELFGLDRNFLAYRDTYFNLEQQGNANKSSKSMDMPVISAIGRSGTALLNRPTLVNTETNKQSAIPSRHVDFSLLSRHTVIEEQEPVEIHQQSDNKKLKFAPYLSYDNYLILNRNTLMIDSLNKEITNKEELEEQEYNKEISEAEQANIIMTLSQNSKSDDNSIRSKITKSRISQNSNNNNNNQFPIDDNIDILDDNFSNSYIEHVDPKVLPAPKVCVSHLKPGSISVQWHLTSLPPRSIRLSHYVVTLIGTEFSSSIKSDSSYECLMEYDEKQIPAVQHCWISKTNADIENKFIIDGIIDTSIYQICVIAVYKHVDSTNIAEYKMSSKMIHYTPLGPPHPPRLRANAIDLYSVSLEWNTQDYPRPEFITGYRLRVNSELNQIFDKNIHEFLFTDMQPGKKYDIEIITLTNAIVGQSEPSNTISLICPRPPAAPLISQLPTVRPNSVVIGWKPNDMRVNNKYDQVLFYKIYLNNKFHGEIFSSNSNTYSYMFCDLIAGKSYDVTVQAFCGERITKPVEGPIVSCLVSSEISNRISVTPTAPPDTTRLRLAALTSEGIEVTWAFPQQYGDALLSGFQMVRNGKIYGEIIPPDVNYYKITDIEIGEIVDLQIISLTNHPVGKYTALHTHPNYTMDQSQREEITNGPLDNKKSKSRTDTHPDYPACKPGPPLRVKYTGLVKPPLRVWSEKVTGYSAIIYYQTTESPTAIMFRGKMNSHFVDPEYYFVSYWVGTKPENVHTIKTDKDFVQLNNLKPTTIYTVQVESRRESKRCDEVVGTGDAKTQFEYKYIVSSKSNQMQFQTASPPDPPTNLSIISTTCHAIKVCWDPPIDHGSELIATRIDCYPLNVEKPLHIYKELTADAKCCIIDSLSEKTNYRITITGITEEYFASHKIKELKQLPKLILESAPWLPSAYIDGMTSGTDPATNLEWKLKHDKTIGFSWKPPKTYGTNRLVNQILCYQEMGLGTSMVNQIPLPANTKAYKLLSLKTGSKYKIWIEAVVLIKLNIDSETINLINLGIDENFVNDLKIDHYRELKDSRCTNVLSESLYMRVPAPCDPVTVNLTGYTSETADIYWAKPCLYSQHRDPDNPEQKIHLYRHLIGYRLEINNIRQRSLNPNENVCTLTKCKPLNTYNIVIVALTCLSTAVESLNSLAENEVDVNEIDESYSKPLQVKLFASDAPDELNMISAQYEECVDLNEPKSLGRIRVEWDIKNTDSLSQFNVNWFSAGESLSQRKSYDTNTRKCYIPVTKSKCIYEIQMELVYGGRRPVFKTERLFIEVPGSPDPPFLWLKNQKENNILIHWSEPRVYPTVPISGYQLYLNDVKVGSRIDKDLVKATLPLKPNRVYKVNITALTSKKEYPDSGFSNSLTVTTSVMNTTQFVNEETIDMLIGTNKTIIESGEINEKYHDSHLVGLKKFYEHENETEFMGEYTIPIKINKLTEDYIDLEWSKYNKQEGVNEYKIQWHCLNSNEHFEHRCSPNIMTHRIKRLKPGYTYCIRISSIKNANTVLHRSKNFIIQMCAPPDAPVLKLRACNFKYITMEWNRPASYGDAQIIGYKLYVDNKVEAVLSSDQNVFTLTKGEPSQEYTFQVQAITADEHLSSQMSAPLKVIWPGILVPNLRPIENESGMLRLAWDEPLITGSAKISYYRVVAECEQTGQAVILGPIDNDIRECEFQNLDVGKHKIHLEITAYGLVDPFCSQPIYVEFGRKPEAPVLSVQAQGLEQRTKLEKIAASLVNKRDRLLKIVTQAVQTNEVTKNNLPKAISTLRQLDEALNDCIKLIGNYTGYFVVNLSWSVVQTNPAVKILGFRVYLNDQQYGNDLHESIRTIRIKLSLERPVHCIYVTAFTDRAKMESQNSNKVELLSENFLPFTFFCYKNVHAKNRSWPERGCCAFQDSLPVERMDLGRTKEPINLGLLAEPIQAPRGDIIDIVTNKTRSLAENKLRTTRVILFWTKWCLSSIRALNYFVMFAKRHNAHADFIACHHGFEDTGEMLDLLRKAGYLENYIKFVNDLRYAGSKDNSEISSIDGFEVKGVPLIYIINRHCQIVWKGRYCSYDYASFDSFMNHTLSEVNGVHCPVTNCEICRNDNTIEKELNDLRSEQKYLSHYIDSLTKPVQEAWTENSAPSSARKSGTRLPKISTRQLISVKTNAMNSNRASSVQGLVHPGHTNIMKNYAVSSKSRPNSTDGFCYHDHKNIKR